MKMARPFFVSSQKRMRNKMPIEIHDYNYSLPEELIAQNPAKPRDKARLLVLDDKIEHRIFSDVLDFLKEGDVLVLNNTKVSNAKIIGLCSIFSFFIIGPPYIVFDILYTKKRTQSKSECVFIFNKINGLVF